MVFYFNLLPCSFLSLQGERGVGPHVGWGEQRASNKILRQRNKHIWNVITERQGDAEIDIAVFSSNCHGAHAGDGNPWAKNWAQKFNIRFSSQQPSGLCK